MINQEQDWRLQGQENYLFAKKLVFKTYSDKSLKSDHDHCEFCGDKFSELIPERLKSGYTTENNYHWICSECFTEFKDKFQWTIL